MTTTLQVNPFQTEFTFTRYKHAYCNRLAYNKNEYYYRWRKWLT